MELKDILSISGKPGLYKFISQGRNGIIVESLIDEKRMNAHATMKISSLEDIAIFTDDGEEPLAVIFKKMIEKHDGGPSIDPKASSGELTDYFSDILPNYEQDRVYASDIKKIIGWYNLLTELKLMNELIENFDKKEAEENKPDDATDESDSKDDQDQKTE
jgi:hypothetical protein